MRFCLAFFHSKEWPHVSNGPFNNTPTSCMPNTALNCSLVVWFHLRITLWDWQYQSLCALWKKCLVCRTGKLPRAAQLANREPVLDPESARHNSACSHQPRLSPVCLLKRKTLRSVTLCKKGPWIRCRQKGRICLTFKENLWGVSFDS